MGAEGAHHGGRQVVLAVGAAWIAAGDKKERGSMVDHDAPCVCVTADIGAILDVEAKAEQIRHLIAKPRSIVLPASPLRESLGLRTVASLVHH